MMTHGEKPSEVETGSKIIFIVFFTKRVLPNKFIQFILETSFVNKISLILDTEKELQLHYLFYLHTFVIGKRLNSIKPD